MKTSSKFDVPKASSISIPVQLMAVMQYSMSVQQSHEDCIQYYKEMIHKCSMKLPIPDKNIREKFRSRWCKQLESMNTLADLHGNLETCQENDQETFKDLSNTDKKTVLIEDNRLVSVFPAIVPYYLRTPLEFYHAGAHDARVFAMENNETFVINTLVKNDITLHEYPTDVSVVLKDHAPDRKIVKYVEADEATVVKPIPKTQTKQPVNTLNYQTVSVPERDLELTLSDYEPSFREQIRKELLHAQEFRKQVNELMNDETVLSLLETDPDPLVVASKQDMNVLSGCFFGGVAFKEDQRYELHVNAGATLRLDGIDLLLPFITFTASLEERESV